MEKVYDYIVVGSGFGGSVASLRLAEKGKGPLRKPCIECAGCMVGCRENALKWFFALSAPGNVSNFKRTLRMIHISLRNPIKSLKVIFNLKWSANLVIFLVMQHIENSMRMLWRPEKKDK